jgi:hypothetical protein
MTSCLRSLDSIFGSSNAARQINVHGPNVAGRLQRPSTTRLGQLHGDRRIPWRGPGASVLVFPWISEAGGLPYGIVAGPDGAMWFTESVGNRIGRIDTINTRTVPSLSQWGLLVLAALLAATGAMVLHRKNGLAPDS